jgi:lipid-A-disaccharide synthase
LEVGYVFGMGGARMQNAGVNVVYGIDKFKIMGFLHVFLKLPMIIKRLSIIKQHLSVLKPDLVVLVDYPGFNMRVAKIAKQLDLKVLYYIAPKLWATREGRAKDLARDVDYLAVIFPFEVDYFKKFKIKAGYVGNPLLHLEDFVAGKLVSNQIAVLPGSRQSEVDYLLPVILESISLLRASMPYLNFVLVQAEGVCLANFKLDGIEVSTKSIEVMSESVLVLLASGTATLEAAILEKPMVVLYKTSWLNAIIARFLLKCKYISLPNILANKMLVSELLQASCSAKNITAEVVKILKNKEYFFKIVKDLKKVKQELVSTNKQDISFVAKKMLNMK